MRISDWSSDVCSSDLHRSIDLEILEIGIARIDEDRAADRVAPEHGALRPLQNFDARDHRGIESEIVRLRGTVDTVDIDRHRLLDAARAADRGARDAADRGLRRGCEAREDEAGKGVAEIGGRTDAGRDEMVAILDQDGCRDLDRKSTRLNSS